MMLALIATHHEGVRVDRQGHVIVCGLHDLGMRVVEQLQIAGEEVVIVDDQPDQRLLRLCLEFGADHLAADARRSSALHEAGLTGASALICLDDSDLVNLEVALLARRLRPDLRVVVQLGNEAVGRAVGRVTGPASVLDVATIAAPTLAESCLDTRTRPLDVGEESFVLQELTVTSPGTLRDLYGDLAPVAVVPADGGPMQVCPGRDIEVRPGDQAFVISPRTDLAERGLLGDDHVVRHRRRRRGGLVRRYLRSFVASSETQLRWTLRALLVLAVVSVVVLRLAFHTPHNGRLSWLDSAYFTTETLTTVGFGDYSFDTQSPWLRVWAIVLLFAGATLVTVLYAMLTNLLVSRRIAQSLGRQLATRMSDHVVLVGLGSVGLRVLERLVAAGQPTVVLERDEDNRFLGRARALDVPVVFGDSTVPASLDAVGLRRARALAVLTSSDLTNIETGLAATDMLGERLADVPVVLRVFDADLGNTIESSFGFHDVQSPAALAAPWFVGAALGLDILTTFYIDRQPILIGRLSIDADGGLAGKPMSELSARIRVVAIRRAHGALEYPPRRDWRFEGGDSAYLLGPHEELLRVLQHQAGSGGH